MKPEIPSFIFLSVFFSSAAVAQPATYTFSEIWKIARERAPEIRAANHEFEASRIQGNRAARHWYPRLFLEGRAYSTDDPTQSFISVLGQRRITNSDFAPQTLNSPGSSFFEKGTLGIDFPLFEGGAKSAFAKASEEMAESKSLEQKAAEISLYTELARLYASLLTLGAESSELQKIAADVDAILSRYKIGAKSNPVGYSGLLGLKNLKNRLRGLLITNTTQTASLLDQIRVEAPSLPETWSPQAEEARAFLAKHLPPQGNAAVPVSVRASQIAASALENNEAAERSRLLPKMGLFGTEDLYGGSRNTATSYTAGIYLQWDLFSATNFGAVSQAEQTAAAQMAKAEGLKARADAAEASARKSSEALQENLSLMEESAKLLEEQTATARTLFRNGSINALQLVEVLARRVDLLASRSEVEKQLAEARAILVANSGTERAPYEE